ncbi:MAG: hypothetical protein KGM24_01135 [Elusimicrobia bacterium]|nr:hypothetical protein [Elusimicrobiota bacterium]
MRTVNSLIDNLAGALKRTVAQNEALREEAARALLQLEHERERLGAVAEPRPDGAGSRADE